MNLFTKINISLAALTSVLNTIAFIFVRKRKPRKSFDILLMNIVFINLIYSLNELSTSLAHLFTPPGMIFRNFKLYFWLNIKSYMIIVTLCSFIVLVAVQRVIVTAFPLKSKVYAGKKNTKRICLITYAFASAVFATLTTLNFAISINVELTTAVLMCIVDAGGVFIILCYTLIAFILKKSSQQKTLRTSNVERSKILRKTIVVAFIVSLSFCISYDPVATLLITNGPEWTPAFEVVLYFVWIDSMINPIMIIIDSYFMIRKFRQARLKKQVGLDKMKRVLPPQRISSSKM